MASTSALSIPKSFEYDVFLSFRGEDTRKNFVDHLYHALQQRGIITYKDDKRMKKGEKISDQLLRSIEDSKFHIIIFSKNYATSSWCLDELAKIIECQKTSEQTAYPIFYDVEPTEVRYQSGAVGKAFARHVKKEGARRWRDALKEAADLAGWELKNTANGHEAQFIQKVVDDIFQKPHFTNFSFDEKLIGMEIRVESLLSSLQVGFDDVRMIGIKGIGGGGKTTLARAVFDHLSICFEGKSFVENVREGSKGSGLKKLQKQVLSTVLNDQGLVVTSVSDGKHMLKTMLCSRKVLLVLDDVDDIEQLEALAGELSWFEPGSRIIITTRDEQVLRAHGLQSDNIHDVNLLSSEEATCLFSRYAFKTEIPIQGYEELSGKVINYAAGLPLTIKVLGSFLFGRFKDEWEDAIERLKTIPLEKTLKKLELSYDGLETDHKEIFLEVACILKGQRKDEAIRILESCGFNAKIGLKVLEEKSMIIIYDDDDDGLLWLHDHMEELGMNIVRRLHPEEPHKHSRLWIKEEVENILVNDLGTEATRSVILSVTSLHPATIIQGLTKMTRLKYLYVYGKWVDVQTIEDEVIFDKFCLFPTSLRYVHWYHYMVCRLPENLLPKKLVYLDMSSCNLYQLWKGEERKVLNSLRFLSLTHSRDLRTFDLGMTPNLELLFLHGSSKFAKLDMPDECPRLEKLILEDCKPLVELRMPVVCPKLTYLNVSYSGLRNLNLGLTPNLEALNLKGCNDFVELNMSVRLPNLKFLHLSRSKLRSLNLAMAPYLQELDLESCSEFGELHMPVECSKLTFLNLSGTKVSNLNLVLTTHLEELHLEGCKDLEELQVPDECLNLIFLHLGGFEASKIKPGLTPLLEKLTSLEHLALSFKDITHLPDCICMLKHLKSLRLKSCWLLEQLPGDLGELECLKKLYLRDCKSLRAIPNSICKIKSLENLDMRNCTGVRKLPKELGCLEGLKKLNIEGAGVLYLPKSVFQLKGLRIEWSRWMLETYGLTSPEWYTSRDTAYGYI